MPMRYLFYIFLIEVIFLIAACGEKSPSYGEAQFPVTAATDEVDVDVPGFDETEHWEVGCELEILSAGRIGQLCVRVPKNDVYRVTLWKYASIIIPPVVVASIVIEVNSQQLTCADITPLYVEEGDRVGITLYTNDFYVCVDMDDYYSEFLPFATNDIDVLDFRMNRDPVGFQYPDEPYLDRIYGVADIAFEPRLD